MKIGCLICCVAFATYCFSTDFKPWYGRSLEFQPKADIVYQMYHHVAGNRKIFSRYANDFFLNLSLANAFDVWAAEIETIYSDTRHHSFDFDCVKLTGRHLFLDDVIGDPVSLSVGLSMIVPVTVARNDISSFHHGDIEGLAHVALGKEFICSKFWLNRYYAAFGIGLANRGFAWLQAEINQEMHFFEGSIFRFFLKGLYGCGDRSLHKHRHFKGYGRIAHRSIDIGAEYTLEFDNYSTLSFEYAFRPFAFNFPYRVNLFKIEYCYPFGI